MFTTNAPRAEHKSPVPPSRYTSTDDRYMNTGDRDINIDDRDTNTDDRTSVPNAMIIGQTAMHPLPTRYTRLPRT